jgi:hypothetical protein
MTTVINIGAGELTVSQLGEQAAEAVRALNHRTRPGLGTLTDPADLCALVAELACLAHRLPQLLGQLSAWLVGEEQAGRLRLDTCSDACSPQPDPATAVATATDALTRAGDCAQHTGRALDAAQQILAHLAATQAGAVPAGHEDRS